MRPAGSRRRSSTRAASANAASMSPFHEASTLSSRPGLTRVSRAAKSAARIAARRAAISPAGTERAAASCSASLAAVRIVLPSKLPSGMTPWASKNRSRSSSGSPSASAICAGVQTKKRPSSPSRVGVLSRVEAAQRVGHLAQHVVERLPDDPAVAWLARHLPRVQVGARELGVVVEHLLEVRHQPDVVHGVAVETRRRAGRRCRRASSRRGSRSTIASGRSPAVATCLRSRNSSTMGCGNLGAPPKPPCVPSNDSSSPRTADSSTSASSAAGGASGAAGHVALQRLRQPTRRCSSTSSRRVLPGQRELASAPA